VLRVATSDLKAGKYSLTGDGAHYVQRVHRKGVGDVVLLFDPDQGVEASGVIVSIVAKCVVFQLDEVTPGTRCGIAGLRLIQGLGKGDKPEQVVKHAVALGVQSIEFVACERSVSRPSHRDTDKELRLGRVAVDVARQCGRSNVPHIGVSVSWREALANSAALGLLVALHTDVSSATLEAQLAAAVPSVVTIVIGPEGGFSASEVNDLATHGASLASLGELILRTELAAVVALARTGAWLARDRS
jgi:16S rRNA (uracil1498-N3)-methyltransferase